jgi:hypothetical protein
MDTESDDLDYKTLSNKDLLDLKEITEQGLRHYDRILKNLRDEYENNNRRELEFVIKEYELCKKYTLEDYNLLLEEIKSRNLDVKNDS